jgi:AMMECR1 domain-containing protein
VLQSAWLITWLILLSSLLASQSLAYKTPALTEVARRTLEYYFDTERLKTGSLAKLAEQFPADQSGIRPAGVFVTLSKDGKSRACWGSLTPDKDLIKSTIYATIGALTREYRFTPVRSDEWRQLKVQVTLVRSLEPIRRISDQNPMLDGLLVRAGGKSGLLLPGEASDAHYQLVQCKLKAGIKPGEPCQLYRIRADVYQ